MGCSKSSQREAYSDTGLPQEIRKTQINNLPSKGIRKRRTNEAQRQQNYKNSKDQR